jgi:hypothetical protein
MSDYSFSARQTLNIGYFFSSLRPAEPFDFLLLQ